MAQNRKREKYMTNTGTKADIQWSFLFIFFPRLAAAWLFCNPSLVLALDFSVSANTQAWQNSGLIVSPNQTITITASGRWCWGSGANDCTGPGGTPSSAIPCPNADCSPFPMLIDGAQIGELVGKIGNTIYRVGSSKTITPNENGNLMLGFNDWIGRYSDNSGTIAMTASISSSPPSPPSFSDDDWLLNTAVMIASIPNNPTLPPIPIGCEQLGFNGSHHYEYKCYYKGYIVTQYHISGSGECYRRDVEYYPGDDTYTKRLRAVRSDWLINNPPIVNTIKWYVEVWDAPTIRWTHFSGNNNFLENLEQYVDSSGNFHCTSYDYCDLIRGTYNSGCGLTETKSGCPFTEINLDTSLGVQPPPRPWQKE